MEIRKFRGEQVVGDNYRLIDRRRKEKGRGGVTSNKKEALGKEGGGSDGGSTGREGVEGKERDKRYV